MTVFDVNGNQLGGFLGLPGFAGGIDVAAGDIRNSDGLAEVLVASATAASTPVQMFAGGVGLPIVAFDPGFGGANGLRIAVGRCERRRLPRYSCWPWARSEWNSQGVQPPRSCHRSTSASRLSQRLYRRRVSVG